MQKSSADIIIDKSLELFLKYGFEKTSTDIIAKTASVSKSTIYKHFKNKDELFKEVVLTKAKAFFNSEEMNDIYNMPTEQGLYILGEKAFFLFVDKDSIAMLKLILASKNKEILEVLIGDKNPATLLSFVKKYLISKNNLKEEVAFQASKDFLSLIRSNYFFRNFFMEQKPIDEPEKKDHINHCVKMIINFYNLNK